MSGSRDPSSPSHPRLVGDVGGTHARFAWVAEAGQAPARIRTYRCADFPGIEQAIARYLAEESLPRPAGCALGLANPAQGDRIEMTNNAWAFSRQALTEELGVARLVLLNDFTALALALPDLPASAICALGDRAQPIAGKPLALLGAGTGLGVSGLLPTADGRWLPLSGEGGHASLAATTTEQSQVVALLREQFGHVSAERVLSGPGLVNLARASAQLHGQMSEVDGLSPQDVVTHALAGSNAHCVRAAQWFWDFMGSCAGNLALTLGATGGVFIGGGLGPRLLSCLDRARFRSHFECKGRLQPYLAPIPCFLICSEESPALLGANRALDS